MDFMRLLRSLEEFVYEVMTWLVFYPRTLLRSAVTPLRMLQYSHEEMEKAEEDQFQTAVSAPLFLILTLVISHLLEIAAHVHPVKQAGGMAATLFASDQNLIVVRALMFAIFPMTFAVEQVRSLREPLTRKTLRGPFFGACYPASVFCLLVGIGGALRDSGAELRAAGLALTALAALWYLGLQTVWLRRFRTSWLTTALTVLARFAFALTLVILVAAAIVFAA